MPDTTVPYVPHQPGDLITAEDWNAMQVDVRQDMAAQIASSIAAVKDVDHAARADKLGDMTLADITKYVLDQAFAQLPKRTGYMQVFLNLKVGVIKNVVHNLKAFPVADVYQLQRFQAVCATDESTTGTRLDQALFYLYHGGNERRIYLNGAAVDIEPDGQPKFHINWKTLIDQLKENKLLDFNDDTTLDELEVDFWKAMFVSPPNDDFDPDAYCHSPWFEKCCGEKRTVGDLTKRRDFENILLKMMPVKTINYTPATETPTIQGGGIPIAPANVEVAQLDLDTVALSLITPVVVLNADRKIISSDDVVPVMLLLKV